MDFLQDIVERAKSYKVTDLQKLYLSETLRLSVNLPINGD